MGRLKLIIKQGSNFSIELYSDNQNNSLLNLQGEKKLSNDVRKLVGVPKSGGNSAGNAEAYECLLTIKHLSFEKKVYSPCRILAIVRFPQNVSHSEVKTLFKNAGVELYNDDFNIAKDYYVHAVSLKYLNNGTSMEVTFEIYSKDKRLTLDKFCKAYTGRKLYNDILAQNDCVDTPQEGADFTTKLVKNNLLANAGVTLNTDTKLTYLRYMKLVKKEDNDDKMEEKEFEFIQPYLVQYNESFYDFLARAANRCGEFLFFEDGMLHLGLAKGSMDTKNTQEVSYSSVSYHDILSDDVVETSYFYHDGTSKNAQKAEGGYMYNWDLPLDDYLMTLTEDQFTTYIAEWTGTWQKKVFDVFSMVMNSTSLPDIMGKVTVNLINASVPVVTQRVGKVNDDYNSRFINCLSDEQKKGSPCVGAPFSTILDASAIKSKHADNLNTAFYDIVRKNEEEVSRNAVSIDLGTDDMKFKLGCLVRLKTADESSSVYIVIEIKGESYVQDNQTVTHSQLLLLPLTESSDKVWATPPLRAVDLVRKSSPQIAIIARNEDPSGLGRVRIRYPWQSDTDDMSPWIRMTTPFATKEGNGMYFAPNQGDEILVDYENGNIERPYMLGALYTGTSKVYKANRSVFVSDDFGDYVQRTISSANGHRIVMTDPKGAEGVLESLWGGYSWLKLFVPGMNDILEDFNALAGGMELTDKYGVYSIKMSSSDRLITINSPMGSVKISALTGISLNAPNGNISIHGKNIDITADNTLTLTSGALGAAKAKVDFKDKLRDIGDTVLFDLVPAVTKAIFNRVLGPFLDLGLLRSILEAIIKPKAGTMKIKSFRYLLMEAGKGTAAIPSSAYTYWNSKLPKDVSEVTLVSAFVKADVVGNWVGRISQELLAIKEEIVAVGNLLDKFVKTDDGRNFNELKQEEKDEIIIGLIKEGLDGDKYKLSEQYRRNLFAGPQQDGIVNAFPVFDDYTGTDNNACKNDLEFCSKSLREHSSAFKKIKEQPEEVLDWCTVSWTMQKVFHESSREGDRKGFIQSCNFALPYFDGLNSADNLYKELKSTAEYPTIINNKCLGIGDGNNDQHDAIKYLKRKVVYEFMNRFVTSSHGFSSVTTDSYLKYGTIEQPEQIGDDDWNNFVDKLDVGTRFTDKRGKVKAFVNYGLFRPFYTLIDPIFQQTALWNWFKTVHVWGDTKEGEILFSDKTGRTISFQDGQLKSTDNLGSLIALKRQLRNI